MSALDVQVGGDHYKNRGIQPVMYIHANGLDFFQGNVVKYVTRWKDKGGVADLEKAKHYLEMYIELERKRVTGSLVEVSPDEQAQILAGATVDQIINSRRTPK